MSFAWPFSVIDDDVDTNSRKSSIVFVVRRSCPARWKNGAYQTNNKVWFDLPNEPISLRHYHQSTTLKHLARFREGLFSFGGLAFVCQETGERLAPFAIPLSFSRFCPLLHRGSIYSQNQLGLRDVSSILFPSEHPEYSDSRPYACMLAMMVRGASPPSGRPYHHTQLCISRSLDASGCSYEQAHGCVWYAQCNVQACVVQRPRPPKDTTHAASGQLHRGLLWQRLTCIPGMLGRILEVLERRTRVSCFARGVTELQISAM